MISRRDFMKSSAAGIAGLMCLTSVRKKLTMKARQRKHVCRTLGKTGMRVPVIGMGMLLSDQADLMRAYMYAYGYRQPALAQSLVESLDLPSRICEDCSSCAVKCFNGWDIAGKIRNLITIG